jgi:UDP-N-acetyl-2-amino-2-deoxyglucuronate dehydrogenase
LHDAHIRFGLRQGADVICEKPLVLNPWNTEGLEELQKETGKKVYNLLQLRLHPAIRALAEKTGTDASKVHEIDLTYITARGKWYYAGWKGDEHKSGGIATNIGIHFFDMLLSLFGEVRQNTVHVHTHDRAAGYLELERARVRWFLSINGETLPAEAKEKGERTYRSIQLGNEILDLNEGFADLHTRAYEAILQGKGFSLHEALPAIRLVHSIRTATPVGIKGDYHPLAKLPFSKHPFER